MQLQNIQTEKEGEIMNVRVIFVGLLSFVLIACGATAKLTPLPDSVTAKPDARYFLHPVKASDTRMGQEGG